MLSKSNLHIKIYIVFVLSFCIGACASQDVVYHGLQHTKGIENSGNKLLLLNILRAGKRYPAYYSTIAAYTGGRRVSADASITTPFGSDFITQIYSAVTKISGNNGLSSVVLDNIGQKKAIQFLHDNKKGREILEGLLRDGMPYPVAYALLVQRVSYHPELLEAILDAGERRCRNPSSKASQIYCEYNERLIQDCGSLRGRGAVFINRGDDECSFKRFQLLFNKTRISPVTLSPVGKTNKLKTVFYDKRTAAVFKKLTARGVSSPVVITYRSPASIIKFIGELAVSQLFLKNQFTPQVLVLDREIFKVRNIDLFKIVKGNYLDVNSKFSINFEGENYYIPVREPGPYPSHTSYEVLSLIRTLIDFAAAETELQEASTVLIQAN